MDRRYSRVEKGKWKEGKALPKKPLVRVPESDVSELIEQNKFTIIGRVTNQAIQKTRALVDFFLQQWNVVGRITGRALGPALFQFTFESEQDLQSILSRAPFHYKRWMLILQRWEPIISESFPGLIPFWINVHGIPLHYWKEETINAIGAALGPIERKEATKARLRVLVNGLKPLIMKMDLQLPSREIVEIELEYEKLDKHCFLCKSLSHEDGACPFRPVGRTHDEEKRSLGISQHNTLERIAEGRRRQDERKQDGHQIIPRHGGARWTNFRLSNQSDESLRTREPSPHRVSDRSSDFNENRRRYNDRSFSHRSSIPRSSPPPVERTDKNVRYRSVQASYERAPLPLDQTNKSRASPVLEASSRSHHSPVVTPQAGSQQRLSARSRLSDPRSGGQVPSDERISAKERLSVNTLRTARADTSPPEIQQPLQLCARTTEDIAPPCSPYISPQAPSTTVFNSGRLGPCERSPIRTLSEDRVHVSLRLGPLLAASEEDSDDTTHLQLKKARAAKAAGKRVAESPKGQKRAAHSPSQGGTTKRRRTTTKAHPSPRRKLLVDAITVGGRKTRKSSASGAPTIKIIPKAGRKEKDFHLLPKSLP